MDLPVGQVDISIYLNADGYAPKAVLGLRVDRQSNGTPVVVELTRGVEARIAVSGDSAFDRDVREGHAFFFLERSQLDLVRGPFPHQGGDSNIRMGVNMWLADYGLMNQSPEFEGDAAELRGLMPGTYSLRAFPDDLVFEPAEVEVVGPRTEVVVRWARR
jgi:hypothetical protein